MADDEEYDDDFGDESVADVDVPPSAPEGILSELPKPSGGKEAGPIALAASADAAIAPPERPAPDTMEHRPAVADPAAPFGGADDAAAAPPSKVPDTYKGDDGYDTAGSDGTAGGGGGGGAFGGALSAAFAKADKDDDEYDDEYDDDVADDDDTGAAAEPASVAAKPDKPGARQGRQVSTVTRAGSPDQGEGPEHDAAVSVGDVDELDGYADEDFAVGDDDAPKAKPPPLNMQKKGGAAAATDDDGAIGDEDEEGDFVLEKLQATNAQLRRQLDEFKRILQSSLENGGGTAAIRAATAQLAGAADGAGGGTGGGTGGAKRGGGKRGTGGGAGGSGGSLSARSPGGGDSIWSSWSPALVRKQLELSQRRTMMCVCAPPTLHRWVRASRFPSDRTDPNGRHTHTHTPHTTHA